MAFSSTWTVNGTGRATAPLVVGRTVIPSGSAVQVGAFTTQTDVRNTWDDGSLRHAMVSFDATSTGAKSLTIISNPGGNYTPTWPSASVAFAITAGPGNGSTYTATLPSFSGTNTVLNGAICRRSYVWVTPTSSGTPHDNLQVFFEVTSYAAGGHKVGIGITNVRNLSTMNQVTANVTTTVAGSGFAALTKSGWTIYTSQRFYRVAFVSMTEADVSVDFSTWVLANCIPTIVDADAKVYDTSDNNYGLGGGTISGAGWYFGEAEGNQSDSENADRQELNPWCDWEARLFKFGTAHYRDIVIRNAQQSGGWCWQIDKDGSDGISILKITDGSNATNVCTDRVAGIVGFDGLGWPSYADVGGNAAWRGAFDNGNTQPNNVQIDREHMPEMNFVAYLITGDTFYLDNLRLQAAWAILISSPAALSEVDPYIWPGYFRGRNGSLGQLNDTEMGRGFGRPLKFAARATWALPDSYTGDYSYFHTIVANNLDAVATYIDYLDAKGWGGSWAHFVGMNPSQTQSWAYIRTNTITTTTSGNPTVFVVVGDNSGTGISTNDHGMQTGDFVTLSGFTTSGALLLNGHHPVVRISATSFSVAINSTSSTSGEGTWETVRGLKTSNWRTSDAAREISWIGFTGLWTISNSMWAFPDRLAQTEMAVQDDPTYTTSPGIACNFYPSACYVAADNLVFYTSWSGYAGANDRSLNTSYLFDNQSNYNIYGSTTHRGNVQGWNEANPDTYYTPYATVMLAHGVKRGIATAQAKYNTLTGIAQVLAELKRRPGFYQSAVFSGGGGGTSYLLDAQPGSYAISGASASPAAARNMSALAGSYAITGALTNSLRSLKLPALAGSYGITGASANSTSPTTLATDPGSYAISGADATFSFVAKERTMTTITGSYAITGFPVTFVATNLVLACPSATGQIAVPYSSSFVASGGTGPYTYAIIAGALPTGLTLTAALVHGTPTVLGTFNFTGQATDSAAHVTTHDCTITISTTGTKFPMRRSRKWALPYAQNKRMFIKRLELFLQVGMANSPPIYLRLSKNGGQTWGDWVTLTAGTIARYNKRVFWNVNSSGRNLIAELVVDASAPWWLVDCFADMEQGSN